MRSLALLALLPFATTAAPVSLESLLAEMTDRAALARLPEYPYTLKQASSYDRASASRDTADADADAKNFRSGSGGARGWFANHDFDMFLRKESNSKTGQTECVMLDHEGPGAIVRLWLSGGGAVHADAKRIRIYLDGDDTPVIEKTVLDLINSGAIPAPHAFRAPSTSDNATWHGFNLYLPIPFAKRCKITWTGGDSSMLYYNINYRAYTPGTAIESFSLERLASAAPAVRTAGEKLFAAPPPASASAKPVELAPKAAHTADIVGARAVSLLRMRISAPDIEQALRSTVLEIDFDGETTVCCPLGAFFGIAHKLRPHKTFPIEVTPDGTLIARWVMPFAKNARVTVRNLGAQTVSLADFSVDTTPWTWDDRSLRFHAVWHEDRIQSTKTRADGLFVAAKGAGLYVGDHLGIYNFHPDWKGGDTWWGEGDEKVYVDGEKFPSNFGTGTEDYYGYAWCRPQPFSNPFMSQPCGEGNKTPGMSANNRYRGLDAIPFTAGIEFTMEQWHPFGHPMNWAPLAFLYARPGATTTPAFDETAVTTRVPALTDVSGYSPENLARRKKFFERTPGMVLPPEKDR